jgi:hypothetical protein
MSIRRFVIAGALALVTAVTVHASPPWISIEYPANPHHPSTRDASLLIRTYKHTQSVTARIDASAVGIVNGKTTTMSLDVRDTALPGVYALRTALPHNGVWVFTFTMNERESPASALVTVNRSGEVTRVTVPSSQTKDGWVIPRAATAADVDAALARAGR